MKLFQKLLITPAVLGLMTPLASSANELNLAEVSSYSSSEEVQSINEFNAKELAVTNSRIDGLEAELNNFEAGSFSETTTMSGSASFQVGAVDESAITEAVTATYSYDIDLNTSFTGDDNLYVGIETGNSEWGTNVDFATDNSGGGGDALSVTSMYYSFPLGEYDVAVGPKLDNDDLMPTTISKYSDKFFMAGQPLTAADFSSAPGITGSGFAIGRTWDNGFNASASLIGMSASTTDGFLTKEGTDTYTLSVGYDADSYGLGLIYADMDEACSFIAGYQTCASLGVSGIGASTTTLGGYWSPNDGKTTLSATYAIFNGEVTGATVEDLSSFHVGVDHEIGSGVLSAAIKQQDFFTVSGSTVSADSLGEFAEVYYTYDVNDSMEITGGVSFAMGDDKDLEWLDRTAVGADVTFKF